MRVLVVFLSLLLAGCPDPASPAPPPKEPRYSIHLNEVGADLDGVVAAVGSLRSCTPRVARGLLERKGERSVVVSVDLSRKDADAGVTALQAAGAKATAVEVPR